MARTDLSLWPRPWTVGYMFNQRALIAADRSIVAYLRTPDEDKSCDGEIASHICKAVNALEPQPQTPGMCVVCALVPVDAEMGFDTCEYCMARHR